MYSRYLLSSEDINTNQVDLSVTVLTSLGSRHINNLTRSTLNNNMSVLSQGRTLHGVGLGGTGISAFKGVIVVLVRHAVICVINGFNQIFS
jgi:hypothetical protein